MSQILIKNHLLLLFSWNLGLVWRNFYLLHFLSLLFLNWLFLWFHMSWGRDFRLKSTMSWFLIDFNFRVSFRKLLRRRRCLGLVAMCCSLLFLRKSNLFFLHWWQLFRVLRSCRFLSVVHVLHFILDRCLWVKRSILVISIGLSFSAFLKHWLSGSFINDTLVTLFALWHSFLFQRSRRFVSLSLFSSFVVLEVLHAIGWRILSCLSYWVNFRMGLSVSVSIGGVEHIFEILSFLTYTWGVSCLLMGLNRIKFLRRLSSSARETIELSSISIILLIKIRNHVKNHFFFFLISFRINIRSLFLSLLWSILAAVQEHKGAIRTDWLSSGFSDQAWILHLSVESLVLVCCLVHKNFLLWIASVWVAFWTSKLLRVVRMNMELVLSSAPLLCHVFVLWGTKTLLRVLVGPVMERSAGVLEPGRWVLIGSSHLLVC